MLAQDERRRGTRVARVIGPRVPHTRTVHLVVVVREMLIMCGPCGGGEVFRAVRFCQFQFEIETFLGQEQIRQL